MKLLEVPYQRKHFYKSQTLKKIKKKIPNITKSAFNCHKTLLAFSKIISKKQNEIISLKWVRVFREIECSDWRKTVLFGPMPNHLLSPKHGARLIVSLRLQDPKPPLSGGSRLNWTLSSAKSRKAAIASTLYFQICNHPYITEEQYNPSSKSEKFSIPRKHGSRFSEVHSPKSSIRKCNGRRSP